MRILISVDFPVTLELNESNFSDLAERGELTEESVAAAVIRNFEDFFYAEEDAQVFVQLLPDKDAP